MTPVCRIFLDTHDWIRSNGKLKWGIDKGVDFKGVELAVGGLFNNIVNVWPFCAGLECVCFVVIQYGHMINVRHLPMFSYSIT